MLGRQAAFIARLLLLGAAWGAALGLGLVAPGLVEAHRVAPETARQWVVLVSAVGGMSALLGAALAPFAAWLVALGALVARRRPRDVAWTGALFLGPALVVAYVAAGAAVESVVSGRPPWSEAAAYWQGALVVVALGAAVALLHRGTAAAGLRTVLGSLGIVAVVAAATLPLRVTPPPPATASDAEALVATERRQGAAPLLLVGIDSGNWEVIRPLVAQGALPTFARLLAGGIDGEVEALWPPYWSGPAWAAILTGHPREETRIYADLTAFAPGLPPFDVPLTSTVRFNPYLLLEWRLLRAGVIRAVPSPRTVLHRPPVWELLSAAGASAGVVRFDFTYPPAGQADLVISNHAGRDIWRLANVTVASDLAAPAALQDELLAPFAESLPFDAAGFAKIVPPSDRVRSPRVAFELDAVRSAYDIDRRTVDAALGVLGRRPDLEFLGVYLGGFDNVCHAFWQYRFPDAYGDARSPAADVAELGPALDRYAVFLDAALGRLLAAYPRRPNVIVVADHGHGPSVNAVDQLLWRGWHGRFGIFVANGPDVRPATGVHASYFDVVPTIADLLGFAVPDGLHGKSLVARP